MTNVNILVGKKVVFTGALGEQGNAFKIGEEYTVERAGKSSLGEGVVVNGIYVIVHGNYEVKRPEGITTAKELLQAIYDEETVVSVDSDGSVDDTYYDGNFEDMAQFEIEGNTFILEDEFNEYKKAVEEAEELARTANKNEVTFAEAIKAVADGNAVEVFVDGDRTDTYTTPAQLGALTNSEINEGKWYIVQ